MELSDAERLILINQYRILAILDPKEKDYYEQGCEAMEEGYSQLYEEFLPHLEKPLLDEAYHLVWDILDVYRSIDLYKRSHPDDTEVATHRHATFVGFDGNNETEYLALTRFIIKDMGRYDEQASLGADDFNSHWPMIQQYQDMVEIWKSYGGPAAKLSKEQVMLVLGADSK